MSYIILFLFPPTYDRCDVAAAKIKIIFAIHNSRRRPGPNSSLLAWIEQRIYLARQMSFTLFPCYIHAKPIISLGHMSEFQLLGYKGGKKVWMRGEEGRCINTLVLAFLAPTEELCQSDFPHHAAAQGVTSLNCHYLDKDTFLNFPPK